MKRVLVCGSRTWNRIDPVAALMEKLPEGTVIIHGAAPGADTIAEACAEVRGFQTKAFPADWAKHGNSAGPIRNKKMLDEGHPDLVVAFINSDSESKGTMHMVSLAEAVGIRVVKVEMPCPTDVCRTCYEPYSNPPTERASVCSNSYHCCRDCVWESSQVGGFLARKLTKQCPTCKERFPDDDPSVSGDPAGG